MPHFLLVYDTRERLFLRPIQQFSRPAPATRAYEAAEAEFADDPSIQVVLVAAQSLEDVKVTHGNFFERVDVDSLLDKLGAA